MVTGLVGVLVVLNVAEELRLGLATILRQSVVEATVRVHQHELVILSPAVLPVMLAPKIPVLERLVQMDVEE